MPAIEDLALELRDAAAHASRIASGHSREALAKRPAVNSWSAAECIEHLNLTTRAYLPKLEAAFEELRKGNLRSDGPYGTEPWARVFRWILEPPVRMRMPTPPPFEPVIPADPKRVTGDFQQLQRQLLELLEGGRGLAIDRVRLVSPFAARVKYNVHSAYMLIAVHQRRHLWQAERALAPPLVAAIQVAGR